MNTKESIKNNSKIRGDKILKRIITKGGLFGTAAKLYLNDEIKTKLFIKECSEQCHVPTARELWGKDLVADILNYSGKRNNKDVLNTRFQVNKNLLIRLKERT